MPRNGVLAGHGVSRPGQVQTGEVAITRPLSAADAARIREIFAWQASGQIDQAARATRELNDTTLLGDILADRYLSPTAKPALSSLEQWLRRWPDQPDAGAIRHLLSDLSRGWSTAPGPISTPALDTDQPEEADPAGLAFQRNPLLDRTIEARLAQGDAGARSALRLVSATRHIDPLYAAMLRAEIAHELFTSGNDRLAMQTAHASLSQSGGQIGLAAYIAGLAAWRQDQTATAQSFFEQASRAALTEPSTRAGSAFWAARAHRRLHDETAWRAWMQRAAASSHTFYGMLAARMLDQAADPVVAVSDHPGSDKLGSGQGSGFTRGSRIGVLGEIDVEAVGATAEGRRAFALLQVGQQRRAEATLRGLWPRVQDDAALCRSIVLVAQEAGMTGLSEQLEPLLQRQEEPGNAANFPVPRLRPRSGFTVNPALVYALTRLESNFDNRAVSGAGAHGLMQIMPVTASFVLSQGRAASRRAAATDARALHNPAFNLEIGQRYISYLATEDGIHGDLIRLLASYNAGPNAVAEWNLSQPTAKVPEFEQAFDHGDPLMFIETLPVSETRNFVHRALTYLWIYAARMDLPAPSLDTLSQDEWPRFDDEQRMASARPEVISQAH